MLYSKANEKNILKFNVLIIDNIGLLSNIYQFGDTAYIGGGFGTGIHNILEAVAFGLPVVFGPNYKKSNEAKELIQSVKNKNVIGGDVVCLMPTKDQENNITAMVAASIMFEIISVIAYK